MVEIISYIITLALTIYLFACLRNIYKTVHRIEDSTYSKLKKENAELRQEIYEQLKKENTELKQEILSHYTN